jgi:adenosine deaminase
VPTAESLSGYFVYRDFPEFIDKWLWKQGFLREAADFELIGAAVAAELACQHIIYAEAFYTPADVRDNGLSPQEVSLALRRGLASVAGVEVALIVDLVRDQGPFGAGRTLEEVAEVAAEAGVVGVGIGGSEQLFPPEPFAPVYARARALGLPDETWARHAVTRYRSIFDANFPLRATEIRRWLKKPVGDAGGIWFLLNDATGDAKRRPGGSMRVRPRKPNAEASNSSFAPGSRLLDCPSAGRAD